jgi:hypothetical protein
MDIDDLGGLPGPLIKYLTGRSGIRDNGDTRLSSFLSDKNKGGGRVNR